MNLFLQAARGKWRFETVRGSLTVEQVFDMPLESKSKAIGAGMFDLDTLAKDLNRQLKGEEEESFVEASSSAQATLLRNKLELVKQVIQIKQKEIAEATAKAGLQAEKQKLLAAIDAAKNRDLQANSVEELEKKLKALENQATNT